MKKEKRIVWSANANDLSPSTSHFLFLSLILSDLEDNLKCRDVVHYIEKYPRFLYTGCYTLSINIPKYLFVNDYPHQPRNLGEKIRKYWIDSGLQIKEFAQIVGVTEDTIINWEKRNIKPLPRHFQSLKNILKT